MEKTAKPGGARAVPECHGVVVIGERRRAKRLSDVILTLGA